MSKLDISILEGIEIPESSRAKVIEMFKEYAQITKGHDENSNFNRICERFTCLRVGTEIARGVIRDTQIEIFEDGHRRTASLKALTDDYSKTEL